jgi:hypothetical protein
MNQNSFNAIIINPNLLKFMGIRQNLTKFKNIHQNSCNAIIINQNLFKFVKIKKKILLDWSKIINFSHT